MSTNISGISVSLSLETQGFLDALADAEAKLKDFRRDVSAGGTSGGGGGGLAANAAYNGNAAVRVSLSVSDAEIEKIKNQIEAKLKVNVTVAGTSSGSGGGRASTPEQIAARDARDAESRRRRAIRDDAERVRSERAEARRYAEEVEDEGDGTPRYFATGQGVRRVATGPQPRAESAYIADPGDYNASPYVGYSTRQERVTHARTMQNISRQESIETERLMRLPFRWYTRPPGGEAFDYLADARAAGRRAATGVGEGYAGRVAGAADAISRGERPSNDLYRQYERTAFELRLGFMGNQALLPSRTPKGGVAAIFGNILGGRREELVKQAEAQQALVELKQAYEKIKPSVQVYTEAVERTNQAYEEGTITEAQRDVELTRHRETILESAAGWNEYTDRLDNAEKKIAAARVGFSGIARNILSVAGGMAIYGAASKVAAVATEALVMAIEPVIDQWSGFPARANKVTTALAEQTVALHGNQRAAMAAAAAQAGLSDEAAAMMSTTLGASVSGKAGAMAAVKQQDIIRAMLGTGGAPTGLYGGYGGILGGPIGGQVMGGGTGFTETLAGTFAGLYAKPGGFNPLEQGLSGYQAVTNEREKKFLSAQAAMNNMPSIDRSAQFTFGGSAVGGTIGATLGIPFGPPGILGLGTLGSLAGAKAGNALANALGADAKGTSLQSQLGDVDKFYSGDLTELQKNARTVELGSINDAAQRGMGLTSDGKNVTWGLGTWEEITQAVQNATNAGDQYGAMMAMQSGIVMKVNGQVQQLTQSEYQQAVAQTALGMQTPTMKQFIDQSERALQAQAFVQAAAAATQRSTLIPGALGAQYAMQRPMDVYAGVINPNLPGITTEQKQYANVPGVAATLLQAKTLQQSIVAEAKVAFDEQVKWVDSLTGQGTLYRQLTTEAGAYGSQIAALNEQNANLAAAANLASYANSIRLANRAISDAKGLLGELTTGLGALQRQEFLLGRQSQALSLELQQRQINYNVALAGFAAPGTTAEERAARIEQAKVEAAYQQKQLDIQTQLFTLALTVYTEQATRAKTDAQYSASVAAQQYSANVQIAANTKLASELQVKQQQAVDKANTVLNNAQANYNASLSVAAEGYKTFGSALGNFSVFLGQIIATFKPYLTSTSTYTGYGTGFGTSTPPSGTDYAGAGGLAMSVSSPTTFLAGEAGNESVFILRNPRSGSITPGDGGGGVTFTFVNNAPVRSDADLYAIQKTVMDILNQKAALQGLRGALIR